MILKLDGKRITSAATLHEALNEVFGFASTYGKNFDALIDVLTHLDNPTSGLSRVQIPHGGCLTLLVQHPDFALKQSPDVWRNFQDAIAFVNFRRTEKGQGAIVALAYSQG